MAVRTISNLGGNYSATGTWVEGVVPTSADDIVATATSGQLTVNVSSAARTIDLSLYTNTVTMNANWTISGGSLSNTIGSSVLWAGTAGALNFSGSSVTITNSTTSKIPIFNISSGNKTISGTIYCVNYISSANVTLTGGVIDISGNWGVQTLAGPGTVNWNVGTTKVKLTGSGWIAVNTGLSVDMDTTGTYSTVSQMLTLQYGNAVTSPTFSWISGGIGIFVITLGYDVSNQQNFGLDLKTFKPSALFLSNVFKNSSAATSNINIVGTASFRRIMSVGFPRLYTSDNSNSVYNFKGGSLQSDTVCLSPTSQSTSAVGSSANNYMGPSIRLDSDFTHTFGNLQAIGTADFFTSKPFISSITASSQVNLSLTSKTASQIINYNFTDINASGQQIVAINGTFSNVTNVTNVYPSGSSSVSGGSWTFVN